MRHTYALHIFGMLALLFSAPLFAQENTGEEAPPALPVEAPAPSSLPGAEMPPVIPGAMSESRLQALRKFFGDKDSEIQRGALCQFASTQRTRQDSHNLVLIKTFTRIVEANKPKDGKLEPESTYACALEALTTTIMTHGTFRESALYKSAHYGGIGSPAFIREHLVPLYLPILKDSEHPLHTRSYYVFMTIGEDVAKAIVPTLVTQLNAIPHYTNETQKNAETLVRTLHVMGAESRPAVPKMLELLLEPGEVDYEGNMGYDGKRGFNAELSSALVSIAGYDKKYQRLILKAINRAIADDEEYWSDRLKPQVRPGTTDLALTMEQSRDKLLKAMGLEAVDDMKDLF